MLVFSHACISKTTLMYALQSLERLVNSMLCCFCFVLPLAPGYPYPTEQVLADVHCTFMNDFILSPSSHFLCVQLSEDAVFLTTGISCNFCGLLNDTILQGPMSHELMHVCLWRQLL